MMTTKSKQNLGARSGVTLIEPLVFVALFAIVSAFTMQALGNSRMLRSNARDRLTMTLIAQSELERIRSLPAAELAEGEDVRSDPQWPSGVAAIVRLAEMDGGHWAVDVEVSRESLEGKPTIRLATIRRGGGK